MCSTFNVFFIQVFKSFFLLFCSFQFIWIAWKVKSRLKGSRCIIITIEIKKLFLKEKSRHVYLFIFYLHFLNNTDCWDYNHNSAGMGGLKNITETDWEKKNKKKSLIYINIVDIVQCNKYWRNIISISCGFLFCVFLTNASDYISGYNHNFDFCFFSSSFLITNQNLSAYNIKKVFLKDIFFVCVSEQKKKKNNFNQWNWLC